MIITVRTIIWFGNTIYDARFTYGVFIFQLSVIVCGTFKVKANIIFVSCERLTIYTNYNFCIYIYIYWFKQNNKKVCMQVQIPF